MSMSHGVVGLCSTGFDWGDTSHLGMSTYFHMSNGHGVVGSEALGLISKGWECVLVGVGKGCLSWVYVHFSICETYWV